MLICIMYRYMQIFELQQETNAFSMFAQNKHAARACLTHEQLITQIRTTMPKMFTSLDFLRCPCLYITYMCIYVYMCVNVHVHVYIYTHTHAQTIHTYIHTYLCKDLCTTFRTQRHINDACTHDSCIMLLIIALHSYAHAFSNLRVHVCVSVLTSSYTCVCTHAYIPIICGNSLATARRCRHAGRLHGERFAL